LNKKISKFLLIIFVSFFTFFNRFSSIVFAQNNLTTSDTPPRLRESESVFVTAIVGMWALTIPYFIFNIVYIGFLYMFSFGDEQKAQSVKSRGTNLVVSVGLTFGGYIVVRVLMQIMFCRQCT